MNTISSLYKWIGNLVGANPSTLTTTSKTLVGAINEVDAEIDDVKNALAWKLKGTAIGQTEIAMPTDYNEILLVGKCNTYYFTAVVAKDEISDTAIYPRASSFYNVNANAFITWNVTNTSMRLEICTENSGGIVHTNTATVKLYYR